MAGKSVVPVEEYLPKLKAALWARQDPDFVIMARTDAAAVYGVDEAVRRACLYAEAGADMVFVEAVTTVEDMRRVNAAVPVPSMANMIEGGRTAVSFDVGIARCGLRRRSLSLRLGFYGRQSLAGLGRTP